MTVRLYRGHAFDVLRTLADESVHCCVTSPPYWGLRDYGVDGQLGLEATPDEYVRRLVEIFREVRRTLRSNGTLWLILGDSFATGAGKVGVHPGGGSRGAAWMGQTARSACAVGPTTQPNRLSIPGLKPKDLVGIPWLAAFALRDDGWWLRSDIIWQKPNSLPESVRDRPTRSHEYLFLLAKSPRYHYDTDAIREPHAAESLARVTRGRRTGHKWQCGPGRQTLANSFARALHPRGRNRRSVWTIATKPFRGAHFATYPPGLVEPCILAGCPEGGTVLDPFSGAATTGLVAQRLGRSFVGIEINGEYVEISRERLMLDAAISGARAIDVIDFLPDLLR